MWNFIKELRRKDHPRYLGGLDFFKYIGPGLLVTVGFIDPGNWASNFAAGADFGYSLLWVITLSTIMLIVLQHNVAHLGIVTGLCLSEAATKYTPKWVSRPVLGTAVLASISTSLAEILGGAIALEMLFHIPIIWGALLTTVFVVIMLFSNSYKRIERAIIAFVSVIGLSFLYELFLVEIDWPLAARSWVVPSLPQGSLLVIMSVLGAVVMPHNLFLHSEVVQSREYNKQDDASIRKLLKYEFYDTLFSMGVGWAINSHFLHPWNRGGRIATGQESVGTFAGQSGGPGVCLGPADGRYLVDGDERHGGRFHLCRDVRRVVSREGHPFTGGHSAFPGSSPGGDSVH